MTSLVTGTCDPRFRRVREVFEDSHARGEELGSAVSVVVGGARVVDLSGGFSDRHKTRPWNPATLVNLFSVTKALSSACLHRLVDQGRLDLDAPLCRMWPEIAQAGKEGLTAAHVLSHRGGLPALSEPLAPEAFYDWAAMTSALAAQAPWWEPGTRHGYHPLTFGWLVGEIVRRVAGVSLGAYLRETITGPLGLDLHVGLAEVDDVRCADLTNAPRPPGGVTLLDRVMAEPTSMAAKAFTNPITPVLPRAQSSRAWRGAEIPSANGHGTAAALASFFAALLVGGERAVLSRESLERARVEQSSGPDPILYVDTRFGLGFMLPQPHHPFAKDGAFGHTGAGGALGFAHPEAELGFGYVMNRCGTSALGDPRAQALSDAVYASL
ncbi:MAG: beta-lactamase family protein [Polyangiaceae bacterium]|jgi:CubicO group peptidase (beta-lactamase class C family)|nr:beta-lactamase family protein [Polyangiaceae bacterium]